MKRIILASATLIGLCTFTLKAQNFSQFQKSFAGKKISSVIEQQSKPLANANQQPISNGGLTISVSNTSQGFNSVTRTVAFNGEAAKTTAECKFVRLKTVNKNGATETFVDTENPFERPAAMEKMGERYDNLIKEKCVYQIGTDGATKQMGSVQFIDSWNQHLPFLSLDSALNFIAFDMGTAPLKAGVKWTTASKNDFIELQNTFTIKSVDEKTITIECSGSNTFIPEPEPVTANGSQTISMRIKRLRSKFAGTFSVDKATGLITEANLEATTASRRSVMGQNVETERQETIKVTNKLN
jgi:Family of unknown function (DUF6263)